MERNKLPRLYKFNFISFIDFTCLPSLFEKERLKLIQLGLPYIVTKPQLEEPVQQEQKFQIEIIDRLDKNKNKTTNQDNKELKRL